MLIDSPSFALDIEHKNKVNNDILKYQEVGLPKTIIIDNRRHTALWLKEELKTDYHFTPSSVWALRDKMLPTEGFNYFSILEKSNTPPPRLFSLLD